MKLTILEDSQIKPELFQWLGRIEKISFFKWTKINNFNIPDDLIEFLISTGGGTAFESEEFLCPLNAPEYLEDFISINKFFQDAGLSKQYIIFHCGLFISAVKISNQKFVLIKEKTFKEIKEFNSFNEWYENTLRFEYAERYGLPKLPF